MRFADGAWAVARLTRAHNGLIAAAGVFTGAWWASRMLQPRPVLAAAAAAFALAAFANASNDWFDVEIDRIAHPSRPLPAGELTRRQALVCAAIAATMALVFAASVTVAMAETTAAVLAVMMLYSSHLKRSGVAGNITVAVVGSLPFVYGAWSVAAPAASVPLVVIALPLHLARELAKDIDDAPGDRRARSTVPVKLGLPTARAACATATAMFMVALVAVVVRRRLLIVGVAPPLVFCALGAARVARGRPGGARLLKTAMVCAMLSLIAVRS